jgi:hypothetical protein
MAQRTRAEWERRPRCPGRHAGRLDRAIEAFVEMPKPLVVQPVAWLVGVEQGQNETGLVRQPPDPAGRLDVGRPVAVGEGHCSKDAARRIAIKIARQDASGQTVGWFYFRTGPLVAKTAGVLLSRTKRGVWR